MKKIVLLLDSDPGYGGTFQYSLSLLDAACCLRAENIEVSVLYTNELWERHIPLGVRKIQLRFGKLHKRIIQASLNMGVPSAFIRRNIEVAYLPARQVIGEHADLYISPSQDSIWSYVVEIPSLAVVHDLMHRYERRFPEVSRYGRYRVREMYLRNTCKYAIGILVDSEIGKKQVCESYNVPPERVFVLPYIPPKYICEKTGKEDQTFTERYSLPPKFFFYPAQFWEHKNHVRLFKALKSLEHELPDIQLLLAGGKKNGYKESRRLVESLGLGEHEYSPAGSFCHGLSSSCIKCIRHA
jgi:glycosyltransferase involved in cell wall biosynthesis